MLVSARGKRPNVAPTRALLALKRPGRRDRRRASSLLAAGTVGGLAIGALLEYFVDPKAGRPAARDRALSRPRRGERRAIVRARRAEARTVGVARRTINAHRRAEHPLDDLTLAQK